MQDRVPQARIYKVWNIPGYRQRDFTLLDIAADMLAGGKNSRLYKRLVYTDRTATAVSVFVGPFEIGSQLQLIVTVKPGVRSGGGRKGARRGDRAVSGHRARRRRSSIASAPLTTRASRAASSASMASAASRPSSPRARCTAARRISTRRGWTGYRERDAGRRACRGKRWLSDGVFVLNVEPVPTTRPWPRTRGSQQGPGTGSPPSLSLPAPQRAKLSNGLEVVVVERHNAPVVDFTLIADAGFAADSQAKPGTARLAMLMLQEGTKTRSSLEIADRAESLGATLGVGSIARSLVSRHECAQSNRLGESLDLYSDVLLNPTFPEKELERLRGQTLAAIQQEKAQPQAIINRVAAEAAVTAKATRIRIPPPAPAPKKRSQASRRAELAAFYKRWVRPDNSMLLVVGDTTLAAIQPLLEQRFGGWRAPSEAPPKKNIADVPLAAKPRVFLIDRPGAEQSQIIAMTVGAAALRPGSHPLRRR